MKFRRKPVEIEAIQWTGENYAEIETMMPSNDWLAQYALSSLTVHMGASRQPDTVAYKDDWIVFEDGVPFCVVTPSRFVLTYEPVEEER